MNTTTTAATAASAASSSSNISSAASHTNDTNAPLSHSISTASSATLRPSLDQTKTMTTATPRRSKSSIISPKNSLWARSNISRGLTIETSTTPGSVSSSSSSYKSRPPSLLSSTTTTTSNNNNNHMSPNNNNSNINERLYNSPTKSSLSKKSPPKSSPRSLLSSTTPNTTTSSSTSTTTSSSSLRNSKINAATTPRNHHIVGNTRNNQSHSAVMIVSKTTQPKTISSTANTTLSTPTSIATTHRHNNNFNVISGSRGSDHRNRNQQNGKKNPISKATTTTTTTTTTMIPSGGGGGGCCCGIQCICNSKNHCDCYEELCQSRAYHMIQSVQTVIHPISTNNNTHHQTSYPNEHGRLLVSPNHSESRQDNSNNYYYKIEVLVRGMTCTMCSQAVEAAIRKAFVTIPSSSSSSTTTTTTPTIDVSLITDTVFIEWIETASMHQNTTTEFYTNIIRQAITAIGYDVEEIQILQHPRNNHILEHQDEENPLTTSTTTTTTSSMSVEDRWQRYRQRQVDKVEQRRCAFFVAMILTVPILMITMILPYVVPHLFQQYQKRRVILPYLHWSLPMEGLILWMFATPVQFICGYEFYKMAWYGFWSGNAGMDLLVAIGTTASYLYALHGVLGTNHHKHDDNDQHHTDTTHFFETSTILIVFVLAGKWMQAAAVRRTSDAITQLMSLQSPTAIRITPSAAPSSPPPNPPRNNPITGSTFNPLYHPYIEEIVNIEDIVVGDMVKVIRGASIPVDGTVLFGDIAVDESMMTGESLPIVKTKGSIVLGGTVCVESSNNSHTLTPTSPNLTSGSVGAAFIQVTGVGSSSALAKIVDLVQQAQSRAVPIQSFADQVSAIFVPTVCAISLVTYLVWYALCSSNVVPVEWYRDELGEDSVTFSMMFAIACLVISCPCALGLATPTAIMVGTGVGAKCGILMKGGSALEVASKVNTVIFDKTGTLTKGVPTVSDMIHLPVNQKTDTATVDYILWALGSLERTSEHPLARAIVKYSEEQLGDVLDTNPFVHPTEFQTITGRGASGIIGGTVEVAVGNRSFASIMGLVISEENDLCMQRLEEVGKTAIIVALNGNVCSLLGIVDEIKEDAAASVAFLRDTMGMDIWMVTGDNSRTAAAISQQIGLSSNRVIAEALPATKLEKVRTLQADGRNVVCMVGDGINDSAALAQADVGLGMGTGADIATEASDMILVKGHVADVCTALHLSRALFRRIQWNLTLSLIYNCLGIPVAVGVFYPLVHLRLPPTLAALAMALSSISVVLSSLMLRFYRPPNIQQSGIASSMGRGRNIMTPIGDDMRLALLQNDHLDLNVATTET